MIKLPEKVSEIINTLENNGFEAYAVGGCIRDSFLGKTPHDWDITTSATPLEVKGLFLHTIDTGIQHGTVTVLLGKDMFEVTTYRIDGEYEDGRHPKQVTFTPSLEEDLKRRDFTINAMAYNDKNGVVDLFGGQEDLKNGIIRCVGDANKRFEEDALRMLRAIRFAARLGFEIEENTKEAIRIHAADIEKVSAERIATELIGLLVSPHPEMIKDATTLGLTKYFMPELDGMLGVEQNTIHHCYDVYDHTVAALKIVKPDKVLRLAVLLHDIAKPVCKTTDVDGVDHFKMHQNVGSEMARKILRRLKLDNDTIDKVVKLVLWHDYRPDLNEKVVRRGVVKIGLETFPNLFDVKRADVQAQSMYMRQEKMYQIEEFERLYNHIMEEGHCLNMQGLEIKGKDLMELGMKPGPEIGVMLNDLLKEVIDNPEKNNRDYLLDRAKSKLWEKGVVL